MNQKKHQVSTYFIEFSADLWTTNTECSLFTSSDNGYIERDKGVITCFDNYNDFRNQTRKGEADDSESEDGDVKSPISTEHFVVLSKQALSNIETLTKQFSQQKNVP